MATSGNQMYGSSLSISSPSSFPTRYDVYFSYRSVDTGSIFVDQLRTALSSKGMQTVCYESESEGLEFIASIFLPTIEMSKIILVVLSENYATSQWCLDELVEILKLKRRGKHQVVPIFYDVDGADVRQQTGKFGVAFRKHTIMKNKKVETWKTALAEIGNLPGYHLPFSQSGINKELLSQIENMVEHEHHKNLESDSINMESGYSTVFSLSRIIKNSTTFKEVRALFLALRTTNINRLKWQNMVKRISRGFEDLFDIAPVSMGLLERLSSKDLTENISKPESLQNLSPSLLAETERPEVQLDFHGRDGTLTDITELLGLIQKVLESRLRQSKSVAVSELKVMHVRNSKLSEIPDYLRFPHLESLWIQPDLDLSNNSFSLFERVPALKVLDMSNSCIKFLPGSFSKLIKLEELHLRCCELLTELHEVSALGNLKVLDLSGCTSLAEIPDSLNFPLSLSLLDLRDCKSLTKLPEGISKLRSLKYLYLSGCTKLAEIPESIEMLGSISSLDLADCKSLTKLPKSVRKLTSLQILDLSGCLNLFEVPTLLSTSLFERLAPLQVLNMSNTSIKTLPSWVFKLTKLEVLILRGCELLMELPGKIGALTNLKVLDLEGTHLVSLPEKLGNLIKLKCLKVSLCDDESYRKNKKIVEIIPKKMLLCLTQLEVLSIKVDPHDTWCNAAVAAILIDLPDLRNLKTLKLYLPTIEILQNLLKLVCKKHDLPIYRRLLNFSFIIGPQAQRFISRLPCELEEEFLKLKKCLKYINGRDNTTKFAEALKHANALYLDRHWTIQKLSVFKFEDLTELKFCLMVDCNEMTTVFDESDFNLGVANNGDNILSLQYLAIHYLKNLENVWKGPSVGWCLQPLKVLVLHMCPNLTTIFTPVLLGDLVNLEEIIVEDCAKITSLIAKDSTQLNGTEYLPRLKKMTLLYLPKLESISSGISIGPELENVIIYNCPKLKTLPSLGVRNEEGIKIKGEGEWWNALEWIGGRPQYLHNAFSELDMEGDFLEELATQYVNSLRLFVEYNAE